MAKRTKIHVFEGLIFFFLLAIIFGLFVRHVKNVKTIEKSRKKIEEIESSYQIFEKIEIVKIDRNGYIHFHDKDDNHLYMIQKRVTIEILDNTYRGD